MAASNIEIILSYLYNKPIKFESLSSGIGLLFLEIDAMHIASEDRSTRLVHSLSWVEGMLINKKDNPDRLNHRHNGHYPGFLMEYLVEYSN